MAFFNRNYKPDTHGLFINSGGGAADLAVNQSFYANLTNNGTYVTGSATYLGIRSPREISIVANLSSTQSGIIVNYGSTDGASYVYRVEVSGGNVVFKQNSGTTLATVPAPSIAAVPARYIIHWSTNFGPEGHYSEFAVCRAAAGLWTIARATHVQPIEYGPGWQFNILGYGAGLSAFTGGTGNIESVRISRRFHTTTEAKEDWLAESSAPSPAGYQPAMELAPLSKKYFEQDPDDNVADNILDTGTLAGPAEWVAALHAGTNRQRLYSPLLNLEITGPPTLQNTWQPTNFHDLTSYPGYALGIEHLYRCPVPLPPGTGGVYGRVRVHVQTWIQAGAPGGTTPFLQAFMRSSDALVNGAASVTGAITCTTNHSPTGIGQWLNLGELPLRVNNSSETYLTLGLSFGTGTGASFRRARIKAIHVDCYTLTGD